MRSAGCSGEAAKCGEIPAWLGGLSRPCSGLHVERAVIVVAIQRHSVRGVSADELLSSPWPRPPAPRLRASIPGSDRRVSSDSAASAACCPCSRPTTVIASRRRWTSASRVRSHRASVSSQPSGRAASWSRCRSNRPRFSSSCARSVAAPHAAGKSSASEVCRPRDRHRYDRGGWRAPRTCGRDRPEDCGRCRPAAPNSVRTTWRSRSAGRPIRRSGGETRAACVTPGRRRAPAAPRPAGRGRGASATATTPRRFRR